MTKSSRRRTLALASAASVALLALAGCSSSGSSGGSGSSGSVTLTETDYYDVRPAELPDRRACSTSAARRPA